MAIVRVLVVDDDSMVLEFTCHLMSREGYEVLQAAGSRQAIRSAKTIPVLI
jgi:DNA-binding response OmpR family regulator